MGECIGQGGWRDARNAGDDNDDGNSDTDASDENDDNGGTADDGGNADFTLPYRALFEWLDECMWRLVDGRITRSLPMAKAMRRWRQRALRLRKMAKAILLTETMYF